jgi:hypothetical protein
MVRGPQCCATSNGLQAGAARMGEHLARMREQQKRAAEASSQQASRELAARFSTEQRTAEIQLRPVMDDRWWENASHDPVASMYHTAAAWRAHSPVAQGAAVHMTDQIRRRYGVDIGASDPATVAERLDRSVATRDQAPDTERGAAGEDRAHGYRRITDADRADRVTERGENAPTGRDGDLAGTIRDRLAHSPTAPLNAAPCAPPSWGRWPMRKPSKKPRWPPIIARPPLRPRPWSTADRGGHRPPAKPRPAPAATAAASKPAGKEQGYRGIHRSHGGHCVACGVCSEARIGAAPPGYGPARLSL